VREAFAAKPSEGGCKEGGKASDDEDANLLSAYLLFMYVGRGER
jgi:hypothetical protein